MKGIFQMSSALGRLDADSRTEFWALLALRHTRGLGPRICKRLLTFFGSALEAVQQTKRWPEAGVGKDKAAALESGSWRKTAKEEWLACRNLDGRLLLWTHDRYPLPLRQLPDPPLFLYCRGDLGLLSGPCLAVVGKRKCSRDGIRGAASVAGDAAEAGMTIVSGMAVGIDRAAHLAAVDRQGGTIAVLGAGLNVDYPRGNQDLRRKIETSGLLLTEYSPLTPPDAANFPIRNRLISGLSLGVLVVEAALQSGSLITARLALEQNRSVYVLQQMPVSACLPESDTDTCRDTNTNGDRPACSDSLTLSTGCRDLLGQGALGIAHADDILRDLQPQLSEMLKGKSARLFSGDSMSNDRTGSSPQQNPTPYHAEKEERVLNVLAEEKYSADELCRLVELPPADISSILIVLEVQGRIKQLSDLRYTLA